MTNPFVDSGAPFGRPVGRSGAGRLPVFVVTGALGAGKTTLIRRLLTNDEARNTALVVNEFGEIGIDDVLLRASGERTVLLGRGCVCCAAGSDLQRTLRELFADRVRGRVPGFERVVIETSGLADPTPILQTLAADRSLSLHYALARVIAVVDAATTTKGVVLPEWARQVALADRVVITKSDLVSSSEKAELAARLERLNPTAPCREADHGAVDA
jgi:G3E family GTPase